MLPEQFKERMKKLLSESEYRDFILSFEEEEDRNLSLRVNGIKSKSDVGMILSKFDIDPSDAVPWEQKGFFYKKEQSPGKHPYHEAGLYYIQESSAMSPVSFLDPKTGEKVLDLCAAPGGKSTQIADRLKGEGLLVTNEINRDRCKILSLNIERMGIKNALVLNEDPGHLSDVFEGYFDKILVDAPCSGEGMFRKNENASDEWSLENVELCAKRQDDILDCAARMLLPGGRMVYSTCTFSPEEDEGSIYRFLDKHRDFHTEKVELICGMEEGREEFLSFLELSGDEELISQTKNSVRLWPHRVKGEGHFLCVLKREGNLSDFHAGGFVPGGRNIPLKGKQLLPLAEFLQQTFISFDKDALTKDGQMRIIAEGKEILSGIVIPFGDQLYLCPEDMPSVKGLKVLRAGLHLGTIKKDRFEPSHALALFLDPGLVNISFDLPSDGDDIKSFLNGQTLRISSDNPALSGKKGWCLITTDGYSIGWGKLAGNMIKNHYPKGLRINY